MSAVFRQLSEAPRYLMSVIREFLRACGFPAYGSGDGREYTFPRAPYSPWLIDSEFLPVYRAVRSHTLVDMYRCYDLFSLVEQVRGVPGDLIEVGTWRGGTGALIACAARRSAPGATVYLCDTFTGMVKTGPMDVRYKDGMHADTSEDVVRRLLASLSVNNVEIMKGIFPEDAGGQLDQRHFRFCHIDVDVYRSARDVFEWVWPRLSPGGVVVFDDFGSAFTPGARQFVLEQKFRDDAIFIHNLNGHAVFIRKG